MTEKENDGKRE